MGTVPVPQGATLGNAQPQQPQGGGAPTSTGMVPVPQGAVLGPPKPVVAPGDEPGIGDYAKVILKTMEGLSESRNEPMLAAGIGIIKGAGETVSTVAKGLNKIPVVGEHLAPRAGINDLDKLNEIPDNAGTMTQLGEHAGKAGEMMLEFMLGDEAFKSLSLSQKLSKIRPLAKLMEESPKFAKVLEAGLRNAVVGGGQAVMHGATPGEAATTGLIAGGVGAAAEAAPGVVKSLVNKVAPSEENVAGENITKLASQKPGASPLAHDVAEITSEPKLAAEQQQAAQRGIKNVATDAGNTAAARAGAPRSAGVNSFEEAADQVEAAAQPHYDAVDEATGGKYTELRRDLKAAYRSGDVTKAKGIEQDIEDLLAGKRTEQPGQTGTYGDRTNVPRPSVQNPPMNSGEALPTGEDPAVTPGEKAGLRDNEPAMGTQGLEPGPAQGDNVQQHEQQAREAWRTAQSLRTIHRAVEGAFNVGPEQVANRAGVYRGINGGQLQRSLTNAIRTLGNGDAAAGQAEAERVLGRDGLDNLFRIADYTSTPERAAQYGNVIRNVASLARKGIVAGGAELLARALHLPPTAGAAAGLTLDSMMQSILHQAAVNPRVGKLMVDAARVGARPEIYAPLIVRAMTSKDADVKTVATPTPQGQEPPSEEEAKPQQ